MDEPARGTGPMVVCMLAMGVAGVPGFAFGLLAPALQAGLGLGRTEIGMLVGLVFGASVPGSVVGGLFTDRFGPRSSVVANLAALAGVLALAAALGTHAALALAVPVLVVGAAVWRSLPGPTAGRAAGTAPPSRLPAGFLWFPVAAFLLVAGSQPVNVWAVSFLTERRGQRAALRPARRPGRAGCGVERVRGAAPRRGRGLRALCPAPRGARS
ncbi:hypothetical protein BJF78_01055 [Pseudonocardia sp. CNS-139]|nr:hypothetical protein BJF78_01055 [Pseudonocardia sp. CNS-139]